MVVLNAQWKGFREFNSRGNIVIAVAVNPSAYSLFSRTTLSLFYTTILIGRYAF